MLSYLLIKFGLSLFLTLLIEILLGILLKIRGKNIVVVVLVNLLTNPLVVYLCWIFDWRFPVQLFPEVAVILIEGGIYYLFHKYGDGYNISKPFLKALALNGASYGIGLIINFIIASVTK